MTKTQRYKQEMLVRVRDFGAAHRELFPESSPAGEKFAQVAAAVAAIDEHLKNRALGSARAYGVKASTRAAVSVYMKTLAKAARRITRGERDESPFRLPRRKTLTVKVATARAFLEEAEKRQAQFVEIGLPPTFISDFRVLVNELSAAADVRLSSKNKRGEAQEGIAAAVRLGHDIVRDLDVIVEIATRHDPVAAAGWRSARRIEALWPSSSTTSKTIVPVSMAPSVDQQPIADPPVAAEPASPSAATEATSGEAASEEVTPLEAPRVELARAS